MLYPSVGEFLLIILCFCRRVFLPLASLQWISLPSCFTIITSIWMSRCSCGASRCTSTWSRLWPTCRLWAEKSRGSHFSLLQLLLLLAVLSKNTDFRTLSTNVSDITPKNGLIPYNEDHCYVCFNSGAAFFQWRLRYAFKSYLLAYIHNYELIWSVVLIHKV